MKISGILTVRNGVAFDYPFIEAAESIMPICDEFVFSEGYSEDDTMAKIGAFSDKYPGKVKVVHYDWSAKHYTDIPKSTNVGIEACTGDYYINLQADEAIHEKYLNEIVKSIQGGADLYSCPILHFWSSFGKVFRPGVFYDEVYRVARRDKFPEIQSIWDGMTLGYASGGGFPMNMGRIDMKWLHYGYVRKPAALIAKAQNMFPWWGFDMDQRLLDRSKGNVIDWELTHPKNHLQDYVEGTPKALSDWIAKREYMVTTGSLD